MFKKIYYKSQKPLYRNRDNRIPIPKTMLKIKSRHAFTDDFRKINSSIKMQDRQQQNQQQRPTNTRSNCSIHGNDNHSTKEDRALN